MQNILTGGGDAPSQPIHEEIWNQIAPLLDGAMEQLGQKDHDALVLRFFENKNFAEVGAALGASEDAAKMRVSRALEKLRKFFTKRGVSSTTAIIAGTDFRQFRSSRARGAGKICDRRGDCQRRDGFHFNLNPHQRSIENYGMDKSENSNRCWCGDTSGSRNNYHNNLPSTPTNAQTAASCFQSN